MHLTSPAFLFLFLPLSLLYIPFCPPRRRKAVLSLVSIAWFFLANLSHPLALIQIGFLLFVVSALSMLPEKLPPRFRLFLGDLYGGGVLFLHIQAQITTGLLVRVGICLIVGVDDQLFDGREDVVLNEEGAEGGYDGYA